MKKGKLIIVSGFSGVGKGTVVKRVAEKYDDVIISVSATTRQPRESETDGVHYFFVSTEKFEKMIENNELLEHAKYVNNYYGTPLAFVEEQREKGVNVILEIEMQGALKVKKKVEDAVMVFVLPPSAAELKNRLINRGSEEIDVIKQRLIRAGEECEYVDLYEHHVINQNNQVEACADDIKNIIDGKYENEPEKAFIETLKNDIMSFSKNLDI